MKGIALIGFMACGKSTLGRILAHEMKYEFVDLDHIIEKNEKRSISDIFATDGEEYFRKKEAETLLEYCQKNRVILSTGGGVISTPESIKILKENYYVVFIDTPFDIMAERAGAGTNRPLFRDKTAAYELWKKRYPMYRSTAHLIYDKHNEIILKSARKIMTSYYNKMKKK